MAVTTRSQLSGFKELDRVLEALNRMLAMSPRQHKEDVGKGRKRKDMASGDRAKS